MNMGIVAGLIKALAPGVDPEVIEQAVTDWLDEHPEATTTVQDGSITEEKLAQDVLAELGEIEELKEAIAYQTGEVEIEYDGNGQVYDYDNTVDITQHTTNTNWRHAVVECAPFDMFVVNVNGGGDGRAWGFASAGGVMLSKSDASVNCRDTVIVAPANAKYLILNDKKSGLTSYKSAFKYYPGVVTDLQNSLNKLMDDQYKKEKIQYTENGYIDTYGSSVLANIYTPTSSNNWRYATIPCNEGDIFIINSIGGSDSSKRPFAFVASDGTYVSKCTEVDLCVNMIVFAPENAAYLIINDRKCGVDSYCVRRAETVVVKNEDSLDAALGIGANKGRFTAENNPDSFVLLHFSDIHGSGDNMKNVCTVKNYLSDVLDDTICTGDILEYYYADSIAFWSKCTDGTILTCIGNHDVKKANTTGYIADQPSEADLYAKFMQNYISKWGTVEHSDTNLYYYKDYAEKGIRLIVLNLLYPSSEKTTEQNTWLATALAGAKTAGYGVVIAQHYYPVSGTKISCTFSAEVNFPTQMYNPQNYMYNGDALTTYQATVQDFIDGGGNFVCWLAGHKHADFIAYHPTYPKQVFIGVGSAMGYAKTSEFNYTGDSRRVKGTRSYDCMNVMAVDPVDKKIKIIRIGCDKDFLGRHRGTLTLDYSTSPATVVYND